jgi:uncharacterized protein
MFAKRQSALAANAGTAPRPRAGPRLAGVLAFLRRPVVAVVAALILMLGAGALFVAVLGDPTAGSPSARASLDRPDAAAADADAPPTGMEAFTLDTLGLYQDLTAPGFALDDEGGPIAGEALITLPDGASAGGGSAITAPRRPPADPLPAAPIAGLSQPGPNGPLPMINADGRTPAQAYARPFRPNGRPRVALIVGGLGLNAVTTRAAIERLPAEVTLSFVPYAEGLQGWIDLARAHGHEVLIEIPMEPQGYPDNDPGPYTLLANAGPDDIRQRLDWLLGRASGYFGVTNYLGERFVASDTGMAAFLGVMRSRGLAFVDDGSARRRPGAYTRASADRIIDEVQSPAAIVAQLNALEAAARENGDALGTGFSYPVTVEAAARWADGLSDRGLQLAPASAMTRRPGR